MSELIIMTFQAIAWIPIIFCLSAPASVPTLIAVLVFYEKTRKKLSKLDINIDKLISHYEKNK